MATPMSVIVRLANAQGNAYPMGDRIPWTGARAQTLCGLSMFLAANDMKEFLSASDTVQTPFDSAISSTAFGPKRPAADHRTAEGGDITFMSTALTEYEWASQYTWHEKALQGNSVFSPEGSQRFYSILEKREKDFVLDPLLQLEKELFATPTSEMFSPSTGVAPIQSIFTKVNTWEPRHSGGAFAENVFPGAMTNMQGLDPGAARYQRVDSYGKAYDPAGDGSIGGSQLAPTKVRYTEGDPITTSGGNTAGLEAGHLLEQMRYLMGLLQWQAVPMAGEFGAAKSFSPRVIMGTREGERHFNLINRSHGEFFATMAPIGDIGKETARFGGISIMACDSMRDAAIYPDITGNIATSDDRAPVTELADTQNVGPRFWFFDPDNINFYFHRDRAWDVGPWKSMEPINEDIMRKLGKSIMNLHATNFMTTGILIPEGGAVTSYA